MVAANGFDRVTSNVTWIAQKAAFAFGPAILFLTYFLVVDCHLALESVAGSAQHFDAAASCIKYIYATIASLSILDN